MMYIYGGTGLIGRELCRQLTRLGVAYKSLEGGLDNPTLELPEFKKTDEVIDLMCDGSPSRWTRDRLITSTAHSAALVNATTAAGAHLVYASSSEIYDTDEHPGNLREAYRASKRCIENLALVTGSKGTMARLFNVYGSDFATPDGRVVPTFLAHALEDLPIPIHGDGLQVRSFLWVEDAVDGLIECARRRYRGAMDIGACDPKTIVELARICIAVTGSASQIMYVPTADARIGTDFRAPTNILPGWHARTGLRRGLELAIELGGNL